MTCRDGRLAQTGARSVLDRESGGLVGLGQELVVDELGNLVITIPVGDDD